MNIIVKVATKTGDFAENKDFAAKVREQFIRPALAAGNVVTLDFSDVSLTTQSFLHALISDVLRRHGTKALDSIEFKGCNRNIRGLIETVVQYSLETLPGVPPTEARNERT